MAAHGCRLFVFVQEGLPVDVLSQANKKSMGAGLMPEAESFRWK